MAIKRKVLFIDRDGTLIIEPPTDFQVDSLEKLEFTPKVIRNLYLISKNLDYELVIVTNQDGLGTDSFPEKNFKLPHEKMLKTFAGEGIFFNNIIIDRTYEWENKETRKPGTALLAEYFADSYDLDNSFVIGDRLTDIQLAKNLGAKAILFKQKDDTEKFLSNDLKSICPLITDDWDKIYEYLRFRSRTASVVRKTSETDIIVNIDLDGSGKTKIDTGLGFFNHMLEQFGKHSGIDLQIVTKGDLSVDEHHTIEDTAIVLGEALAKALGDKRGIERYGFVLPMDESLCSVALDFGGRPWIVWDAEFHREKIGDMPTEMFFHFFKSISDAAKMNIHIIAKGTNEHHKIEGIFKAFAKAIKSAIRRDPFNNSLPSTKGKL